MLQERHLRSEVQSHVIEERSAHHLPVSQHRSVTQIICSTQHGQHECGESAGQPHMQQHQGECEQIGQLRQLLFAMPKLREQFDQCILQTTLAQQAFGQGRQPDKQITPPQTPPPGWVERRDGGNLPERSWADMSEQGQSHGLRLMDRPPMGGQQLASSPMLTKSAIEDGLTSENPTLLTYPGSVRMGKPGTAAVNTMFGGTFADREQSNDFVLMTKQSKNILKSDFNEHGLFPSMKSHLQAIADEDSATVFVARRIKKLGYSSPALLRTYFQSYGEVKDVYANPSFTTASWPNHSRGEHRSPGTQKKLRLASLAFVVMASANSTARILADGPGHSINGVPVLTQAFQRRESAQHPEGEADECHWVPDSSAVKIGAVDYPRWPSTDSETEGDNNQRSQMVLHCPLPQAAEHAASGEVTQQDLQ